MDIIFSFPGSLGAIKKRLRALSHRFLILVVTLNVLQGCGGITETMLPYLKEHRRLEAQGEDAQAQILSVLQTGRSLNRQPEIELELKIFPANYEPYNGKTRLICPLIMIPSYQPGKTVVVKIDKLKKTVTVKGSYQQTPGI